MLHYLSELHSARHATSGRRRYNLISCVVFIVVAGALFATGAPFPIFVAFFWAAFVLDIALVVRWARKDALAAYRLTESEPYSPPFGEFPAMENLDGPTMIYSLAIRTIATVFVLAFIAGSTVVGLLHEPRSSLLAWTSLIIGAISLSIVLATKQKPKRDAVLFIISGTGGSVFVGASTVGFPGSLPIWLWIIGAMCIGTVALIVDAESAQSKSVNRL